MTIRAAERAPSTAVSSTPPLPAAFYFWSQLATPRRSSSTLLSFPRISICLNCPTHGHHIDCPYTPRIFASLVLFLIHHFLSFILSSIFFFWFSLLYNYFLTALLFFSFLFWPSFFYSFNFSSFSTLLSLLFLSFFFPFFFSLLLPGF